MRRTGRVEALGCLLRSLLSYATGRKPIPPEARIGRNVFIGLSASLDWIANGRHISIGDDVVIVDGVRILCHDASSNARIGGTLVMPVTIEDRAFIGANSIIMPGVRIGADSVIGAGSVVTRDVPARTVMAGVPARIISSVDDLDAKRLGDMKTRKGFDLSVYGRTSLSKELASELGDAVSQDGGYYLVKSDQCKRRK